MSLLLTSSVLTAQCCIIGANWLSTKQVVLWLWRAEGPNVYL